MVILYCSYSRGSKSCPLFCHLSINSVNDRRNCENVNKILIVLTLVTLVDVLVALGPDVAAGAAARVGPVDHGGDADGAGVARVRGAGVV